MDGLRLHLMRHRALAAVLIGAALLLRAMVPAGYMIAPTEGGRQIFVTVCSGLDGKVAKIALPAGKSSDSKSHDAKDSPCAFTALVGLADVPVVAAVLPVAVPVLQGPAPQGQVAIGRGLAAPPPPQTGPPIFA